MTTESKPKRTRALKPTNEEVQTAILKEKTEPSWFNCSHEQALDGVRERWRLAGLPENEKYRTRIALCFCCQGPVIRKVDAVIPPLEAEFCRFCVEAMEVEG